MTTAKTSDRSLLSRFDTFRRADLGSVFAIISLAIALFSPETASILFALIALYMLIFLSRRPKEEFARACWMRGCSTAFIAMLLTLVLVPFVGGFIDGFTAAHYDNYVGTPPPGAPASVSPYEGQIKAIVDFFPLLGLLAFFIGFQWQRFRGGIS